MSAERPAIGIVGARGHVGAELIRLLAAHPRFELAYVSSRARAGRPTRKASMADRPSRDQ